MIRPKGRSGSRGRRFRRFVASSRMVGPTAVLLQQLMIERFERDEASRRSSLFGSRSIANYSICQTTTKSYSRSSSESDVASDVVSLR